MFWDSLILFTSECQESHVVQIATSFSVWSGDRWGLGRELFDIIEMS